MKDLRQALEGHLRPNEYERLLRWLDGRDVREVNHALGYALGFLKKHGGDMLPPDLEMLLSPWRRRKVPN